MKNPDRRPSSKHRLGLRLGGRLTELFTSDLLLSAIVCMLASAACWGFAEADRSRMFQLVDGLEVMLQSDAVVVLAGDEDRWKYAETLVQRGVAPRALSTLVEARCLPENSTGTVCLTGVRNTVDEALVMRRILTMEHVHHATVVTSDYHILRAGAIFAVVFAGSGIQIDMTPAPAHGPFHPTLLFRELGMLGPSIGGSLLGRFAPTVYERLMRYRYLHRNQSVAL